MPAGASGGAFEPPFLIGIDVGTQTIRAIAFDARGRRVVDARRATPTHVLGGGRGEYDPDELFATVLECLTEAAAGLGGRPVAGMAVASIGESCVLVDAEGRSLAPSLMWFDRRTEGAAEALTAAIGADRFFQITGLSIDPTFTLVKLVWMKENLPDAIGRARHVLNIADWIAFRLSGVAATDLTLASRTLYLDVHERRWSEELLEHAGIDAALLPPLNAAGTPLGPVRPDVLAATGLAGRPVVAVGGHDHLVGSYAAGITRPGLLLDSMGTAEAILLATGFPLLDPRVVEKGFIQGAVATHRALSYIGGGIISSGGAVEWFRGMTGDVPRQTLIAEAEAVAPGSQGAVFLPHLVFAPPPDPDTHARGAFIGLAAHTTRAALYRSVLEGLAMQAALMLEGIESLPGIRPPDEIRVIGGSSRNALFVKIKAAAYGRPIIVVDEAESTTLGAALLGGIGAGVWPDLDAALAALGERERVVEPDPEWTERYAALKSRVFSGLQEALRPFNRELTDGPKGPEEAPADPAPVEAPRPRRRSNVEPLNEWRKSWNAGNS